MTEPTTDRALIVLHSYGYFAATRFVPEESKAKNAWLTAHVEALRGAVAQYYKDPMFRDPLLKVVDCWSGDTRLIALHYAQYARASHGRFQALYDVGERLRADESTAWKFMRFYKETTSQRAREAIDDLFRGWEEPPRWFFLAGEIREGA